MTVEEKLKEPGDMREHLRNIPYHLKIWYPIRRRVLAITDIPHHIRRVKWFIQRGRRGYADRDCWHIASYLVEILPPMLKKFKADQHGYPGWGQASTVEKWDSIIDRIIEGFEAANRMVEDDYFMSTNADILTRKPTREETLSWLEAYKVDEKIFKDRMKLFTKWFFHLWD